MVWLFILPSMESTETIEESTSSLNNGAKKAKRSAEVGTLNVNIVSDEMI